MQILTMTGFLPVIFTLVNSRRKRARPPVHLPTDADADEDLITAPPLTSTFTDEIPGGEPAAGSKAVGDAKPMRGWAYLLLWLPAACDLTGTTVSLCPRPWLARTERNTSRICFDTLRRPGIGALKPLLGAAQDKGSCRVCVSFAGHSASPRLLLGPLRTLLSFP